MSRCLCKNLTAQQIRCSTAPIDHADEVGVHEEDDLLGGMGCLVCFASHNVLDWTINMEGFGSVPERI
jgi:hypothetical protein